MSSKKTVDTGMVPVVLKKRKSAKASKAYATDLSVFNETLKSVNVNLLNINNQIENIRTQLDNKITQLDNKIDRKLTILTNHVNEKNEKTYVDLSNQNVEIEKLKPVVLELKTTVLEKEGLKEKVQSIEQEKLISKTWLTIMFSVISVVASLITFYFEKIIGVVK